MVWIEEQKPKQLAECILELLNNNSWRREIGAKLRKRAALYLNWEAIADRTLAVYADALKHKPNENEMVALPQVR